MRVVVADATPLHYLILIEVVHVLPQLFEKIHVPAEVRNELIHEAAPAVVRTWMRKSPAWLDVLTVPTAPAKDSALQMLDSGERAAIVLAESIRADLLLIDDRAGAILFSYVCRKLTSGTHLHSWRRCWRKRKAAGKEPDKYLSVPGIGGQMPVAFANLAINDKWISLTPRFS